MVRIEQALIDKIKELANGTVEDQIIACKKFVRKQVFPQDRCVDPSVIPELLPLFIRFMKSEKYVVHCGFRFT